MQNNQKVLMLGGGTSSSMLLRLMASSTLVPVDDVILSEFAVNDVEAALALSFITNEYRTGNSETTFADAFTGTSPKLTYSTAAGSNSTMVNSSGNIVWAPHNLVDYSEDFSQSYWVKQAAGTGSTPVVTASSLTDPAGGTGAYQVVFDAGAGTTASNLSIITTALVSIPPISYTNSIWVRGDVGGEQIVLRGVENGATFALATLTTEWQRVTFTDTRSTTGNAPFLYFGIRQSVGGHGVINSSATVHIWGAHVYRSDLGGMAQVPGADTGFEYYVPTNGNAEYLPRVGHHVYNGTTWVNEGLLIESEARSNLVTHSEDFSQWSPVNVSLGGLTTGPSGSADATPLIANTANNQHRLDFTTTSTAADHTFSVYAKSSGYNGVWLRLGSLTAQFDLATETIYQSGGTTTANIEDAGNGWYRVSISGTAAANDTARINVMPTGSASDFAGDGTSGILIYGAQLEAGSTPSSYMPTSGGTYTRTAQSLTVPPAQFGWPEPEYIGPELVVDGSGNWIGDFDVAADLDEWTAGAGSTATWTGGKMRVSRTSYSIVQIPTFPTTVGQTYLISADISGDAGRVSVTGNGDVLIASGSAVFVATSTSSIVWVRAASDGFTTDFDNISVREINPLSVSIQMDGRMTYADEGLAGQVTFARQLIDGSNYVINQLSTFGGNVGLSYLRQSASGIPTDLTEASPGSYTPGVLVPFNIASRHGSTFVNGAVDGVALTANTTPTALPDLSSTNLQIAYDFMGTIGTFRQFAGDIGDTGLVTATNPSTEPTLSLTFDGSEGSFYNLSWSE
jgi:hypothetical protein